VSLFTLGLLCPAAFQSCLMSVCGMPISHVNVPGVLGVNVPDVSPRLFMWAMRMMAGHAAQAHLHQQNEYFAPKLLERRGQA